MKNSHDFKKLVRTFKFIFQNFYGSFGGLKLFIKANS